MTVAGPARPGTLRVDPLELGLAADPYPVYAQMRASGALVAAGPGTYAVTRHHDVAALLREPRLSHRFPDSYRSFAVGTGPTCELLQRIVSSQEPPAHTTARQHLGAALEAAASQRWWQQARSRVDATVRAAVATGRFDAVTDLATPLAVDLVGDLYDLDAAERAEVARAAPVLGRALTALRLSADDREAADAAVVASRRVLGGKPGSPDDPVALDDAVFLCFTAIEMITSSIATCVAVLLAHPDQLARLRADRGLLDTAVAELLRFDSPTQGTLRRVVAPLTVDGQAVRPGRALLLLLGAANHDEAVFAEPARLDLGRAPNPHLSFGGGPYRCLGAHLATRICATLLDLLLTHTSRLEPAGEPRRHPPETFCRSYAHIPVEVTP